MAAVKEEQLQEVIDNFKYKGTLTDKRPYGSGHINDTYLLTFEDEAGEVTTIEKEMTLFVNEMYFPDDMEMDGMYGEDMTEQPGGFKIWWVIVPVVLIVIGIIIFVVIRRKKKKKAQELLELEEDLDDISSDDRDDSSDDGTETEKLSPWKRWKKRRAEKRNGL